MVIPALWAAAGSGRLDFSMLPWMHTRGQTNCVNESPACFTQILQVRSLRTYRESTGCARRTLRWVTWPLPGGLGVVSGNIFTLHCRVLHREFSRYGLCCLGSLAQWRSEGENGGERGDQWNVGRLWR